MFRYLNYTHEDYLVLSIINGEYDKAISNTFATRFTEKQKPSPNIMKRIIQNFKSFFQVDNINFHKFS